MPFLFVNSINHAMISDTHTIDIALGFEVSDVPHRSVAAAGPALQPIQGLDQLIFEFMVATKGLFRPFFESFMPQDVIQGCQKC